MKANKLLPVLFSILFMGLPACESIVESFSISIPIKPAPITFNIFEDMDNLHTNHQLVSKIRDSLNLCLPCQISIKSEIEKANHQLANLQALTLDEMQMEAKSPQNYDMTPFIGLKIYFNNDDKTQAEATSVSNDKKTLIFTVIEDNMMDFAQKDIEAMLIKGPIPKDFSMEKATMELRSKFTAKIKINKNK